MNEKRLAQKKATWIKNIMKVYEISRIEAEKYYTRIKPYSE